MTKRVIVVGAGFGGLSAACLLAKQGYEVTLIEKNDQPGGRAMGWKSKGFFFDMGPSWYLMPEVFEKFFATFGKKTSQYYRLKRLDPSYRLLFGPQDAIDIQASLEKNLELFDQLEKDGAQKFKRYLASAQYQYEVAMREFIYKDYQKLSDFFSRRLLTEGRQMRVFESFDKAVKRYFENDRIRKIVEYTVVFLGGNPKKTPALYSLMAHVDFNLGVWYPYGGMNAVAKGMYKLAREHGVHFVFNEAVTRIIVEDGVARSVETQKQRYDADIVLVNADYAHAETQLLEQRYQSYPAAYWKKRTIAPSGFILYLGVKKRIRGLLHHTLFLENDWEKHFTEIFDKPAWPDKPSYYVCAPSKTDPGVAPAGSENLFVLVPVASNLVDTPQVREAYADKIIAHLEQSLGEPIRKHIVVKRIFAHHDFETLYNAYNGTALGLAHTLRQSALFRPQMRSSKVRNLYYAGQYTHPGIGVPMVVIAATIVAQIISSEHPVSSTTDSKIKK